jgi:uncharacterized protein
MSKITNMEPLALFPLNTVLFPGMPLDLHIFEDRYKLMIAECLRLQKFIGVVLIEKGKEAYGPLPQPYLIGCTARITKMEPLDHGRMNISTVGVERFRIVNFSAEMPYLIASVVPIPIPLETSQGLEKAAKQLASIFKRYLRLLAKAGNLKLDISQVPTAPEELAYVAGHVIQIPASEKQSLLESRSINILINGLNKIYRREVLMLDMMTREPHQDLTRGFSSN